MCGIAGVFAHSTSAPPIDEHELLAIRDAMENRGPDGAGLWISNDRCIGLAHRRLSIIDVSDASSQPLSTPDGRLWITFNGEIYNYISLREDLKSKGHVFRTAGDTEVLLHLYMQYGIDMVKHLRGMFAFAIWDEGIQALFLARDHFGIKPLYYSDDGNTLRFASQVKALLKSAAIPKEPDYAGIVGFYLWGCVPDPFTTYSSIKGLPAGHTLLISRNGSTYQREFFNLAEEYLAQAEDYRDVPAIERQQELAYAIRDSVRHHLVADVPIGVFLSAGLDSSVIAGHASEISSAPLQAVTLGFCEYQGTSSDELPLATAFANTYQLMHHIGMVTRDDFEIERQRILEVMDQPSVDGINTYFVSKVAANAGLKVSLSGLGGDELFGGYPSFLQVPRITRLLGFGKYAPSLGKAFRKVSHPLLSLFTSTKYASALEYGGSLVEAYFLRRALWLPWELDNFLDPQILKEGLERLDTINALTNSVNRIRSDRDAISILESSLYMRSQLLRDSDWAGMAHSLEIRVPFVDVALLRTVLRLGKRPKPISKINAASTLTRPLVANHLNRTKTGFHTPVSDWISKAGDGSSDSRGLRGWAKTILNPMRGNNILFLAPDAFGGIGGISQFNRDVINALLLKTPQPNITVIPRVMPVLDAVAPFEIEYIKTGLGSKLQYSLAVFKRLLATKTVDVILCGHINLMPLAYIGSLIKRCPLILFVHGIEAWAPPKGRLIRLLVQTPTKICAVSKTTADRLVNWSNVSTEQLCILPNTFHPKLLKPGPKPQYLLDRYRLENTKVILTLGRLASEERFKGFDEVLDILPSLLHVRPEIRYVIAGAGNDMERLKNKATNLKLSDYVVFTGFIPESEKADLFRLADAFVMPSRGEGFGIVFLEALASGIPVIGSKLDGGREALRDGLLGILVDPDNLEDIKQAVIRILDQPRGAIPEGLSFFSFDNFALRLNRVIATTLNGV